MAIRIEKIVFTALAVLLYSMIGGIGFGIIALCLSITFLFPVDNYGD